MIPMLDKLPTYIMKQLESVQYDAALLVSGCVKGSSYKLLLNELIWNSLEERFLLARLTTMYKFFFIKLFLKTSTDALLVKLVILLL